MTEKGPTTLLTGVIGNRSFGAGFPRAQTLEDSTPISSVVWENGAKDTGSGGPPALDPCSGPSAG